MQRQPIEPDKDVLMVEVGPPTAAGRLYPRYSEDSEMLVLESEIERDWPIGVEIDGLVVLDFDQNRLLANVDLMWPRNRWPRGQELPAMPKQRRKGDLLVLDTPEEPQRSLDAKVSVNANRDATQVVAIWSPSRPTSALELSPQAWALMDGNALLGVRAHLV